jgi:CRISPR-associated protein Cpf1
MEVELMPAQDATMQTNLLSTFTDRYKLSKTLRFELIPQGKTQYWIDQKKFIEKDKQRAENAKSVKIFIDDYHRWFIADVLKDAKIDGWDELEQALNDNTDNAQIEKLQEIQRKRLVALFTY